MKPEDNGASLESRREETLFPEISEADIQTVLAEHGKQAKPLSRFLAYAYRRYDAFDIFGPEYQFMACMFAASLKEARVIAGQLAPVECNRFMIVRIQKGFTHV